MSLLMAACSFAMPPGLPKKKAAIPFQDHGLFIYYKQLTAILPDSGRRCETKIINNHKLIHK